MNRLLRSLLAVAAGVIIVPSAQAALAQWTFDGSTPFTANTHDAALSTYSLGVASAGTISTPTSGAQSGGYLLIAGKQDAVNGSTLAFTLKTISGSGVSLSLSSLTFYYDLTSKQSPSAIDWSYSIVGGGSGSLASTTIPTGSGWSSQVSEDLSKISALSGNQTIIITGSLVDAGNAAGADIGFDSFTFNGISTVPEPVNVALGIFAGVFFVVIVARSRPVRNRVQHYRAEIVQWINAV